MDIRENCFQNRCIKMFVDVKEIKVNKLRILVLLFFLFIINYCFSQNTNNKEDIITLKNNKIIKGYILNKDFGVIKINAIPVNNILLDTGHNLAIVLPLNFTSEYKIEKNYLLEGEIVDFHLSKSNSLYYIQKH